MNSYIADLNWRYATKKFDASKSIAMEDLDFILEATRLSTSSYGLQPYHIFVITDPKLRTKLQPVSWGQSQIVDASHLIVFANKVNFGEELLMDYLENVSRTRNISMDVLSGYGDFMKSKLISLSQEDKEVWTAKQTYLALGNLLNAAAFLKIDACPMEGFESEAYNDLLGLKAKGLNATVAATIGYRSAEDETQAYKKVRQSKEQLFTHI